MKNSVRISTILFFPVILCVICTLQGSFRERWESFKTSVKKLFRAPRDKIIAWHERREEKKKEIPVLSSAEVIARQKAEILLTAKRKIVTSPEVEAKKKEIAMLKWLEKKLWKQHAKVEEEQGSYAANKIASKAMDLPFKIKNLERELADLKAQEMVRQKYK